jgi:RimJ/RimL family protein N-acetyltransferase
MDFRFTTEESVRRADEIADYLRGPRLWIPRTDYPDFEDWLSRAHSQLKREEKRAVVALDSGRVAGVVLYQEHRGLPGVLELKNITVRPDVRGRHFAAFMLRNAEVEGLRDFGCSAAVVDAKAGNAGVRRLLLSAGYRPWTTSDLYGLGAGRDVVYSKSLSQSPKTK